MTTNSSTENQRVIDTIHVYSPQHKKISLRPGKMLCVTLCVIGIITALFLILAAHQILPCGTNAISSIGVWGYVLSWGAMAVLTSSLILCAKLCVPVKEREAPLNTNGYRNALSLLLNSLSEYDETELFVTEDHYCFVIEEYLSLLDNQFCFYNPYTQKILSDTDIECLKAIPSIQQCWNNLKQQQQENASKTSEKTIDALIRLAEGYLNRKEILQMSHKPVPVAQGYLDQFACYYNDLGEEEKDALDKVWVPQCHYRKGTKNTRFGDLYASMDQNCVHDIGDQIILMVWQLKSDAEFHVEGIFAQLEIQKLRKEHEEKQFFV